MAENVIDLATLKADMKATDKLREVLHTAMEETETRILDAEGRLMLLSAILPAFAPGLGWKMELVR